MIPTRTPGLRFRIRHLLIVVAYFAVILGGLVPILRYFNSHGLFNSALAILFVSPWLLGLLVLLLERKGPIKYWAAPVLLSLASPALALCHDWLMLESWRQSGTVPNVIISLVVNILLIGAFTYFVAAMSPDHCPRCGHRTLIPLLQLWGRAKRTANTRWCGSCGAQYWRQGKGIWQKERRTTWVDAMSGSSSPDGRTSTLPKPLGLRKDKPSSQRQSTTGGA